MLIPRINEGLSGSDGEVNAKPVPIANPYELAIGNAGEKFVRLWEREEPEPMEWLIEGLVPKGFVTILYGNSGLGKSYLCKWIATCIAMGGATLGNKIDQGNILWLDFEMNEQEACRRLWRVARGLGLENPPRGFFYYRPLQSLGTASLEEEVCAEIRDKQIKLVVIDSLSVGAAGLDVSEHKDVVTLLKSAEKWGTVIAIDHITKAASQGNQSTASIFGSTFKRAIARSTMLLTPAGDSGFVALQQGKNNFGQMASRTFLNLDFDNAAGSFVVREIQESDPRVAEASRHMSAKDQLWHIIVQQYGQNKRPVSLDDLLQATGKSESTIRSYLSQLGARVVKHGNNCYSPRLDDKAVLM